MQETWVQSLGWDDPLKKGKATHSSILAWRIPWTIYSPWGHKELYTTEWFLKTKQKINKDIVELNNNTNQLDRTDIYRLSFNSGRIHIFANFTWNINQEDHILGTKCTLKSFKK